MLESTVRKQASQLNQMKNKMLSGESIDVILNDDDLLQDDIIDGNQSEVK
jgi:hypothetical protein